MSESAAIAPVFSQDGKPVRLGMRDIPDTEGKKINTEVHKEKKDEVLSLDDFTFLSGEQRGSERLRGTQ